MKRRCAAAREGVHHHPHHADGGLRLGCGAQFVGQRDAVREAGAGQKALSFAGWITREAGEKLLALAGKNVDELLKAAETRDFQPIDLGMQVRGTSAVEGARAGDAQRGGACCRAATRS